MTESETEMKTTKSDVKMEWGAENTHTQTKSKWPCSNLSMAITELSTHFRKHLSITCHLKSDQTAGM